MRDLLGWVRLKEGPVDAVLQLERMKHVGKEGGRAAGHALNKKTDNR